MTEEEKFANDTDMVRDPLGRVMMSVGAMRDHYHDQARKIEAVRDYADSLLDHNEPQRVGSIPHTPVTPDQRAVLAAVMVLLR